MKLDKTNKSFEYLLERNQDKDLPENSIIREVNFEKNKCYDFFDIVKHFVGNEIFERAFKGDHILLRGVYKNTDIGKEVAIPIKVYRNRNCDFEYYTSSFSRHDGTLWFVERTLIELTKKVLYGNSFNLKLYSQQEAEDMIKSGEYEIVYEVGDIVDTQTFDSKPHSSGGFPTMLSCCFLPLKMHFEKINATI